MDSHVYAARRARLLDAMGERAVAVFGAAPAAIRNNDVEHEYRQDSDLYYLTGLDEPGAVLVLSTAHEEHRAVLFVRPKNPEREVWDGPRAGTEGAVERFGADVAFEVKELGAKLPEYLVDTDTLYYRVGLRRRMDERIFAALAAARRKHRFKKGFPQALVEPGALLHEHRLVKGPDELEAMRRAAAVTETAHRAAMRVAKPGAYEYEVEAEILRVFRAAGSERPAYGSIVGSGPNATILHHRKNDRQMQDGELLLIDAGCELDYYAADVTRTFPVSGRFSAEQRTLYELVLDAQRACVAATAPGVTLDAIHDLALRRLTEGLIDLGFVEGPLDAALEEERYKPFYMHRTSHWLGMDVHDVGLYYQRGEPRPLEPGMVFTIEPGLYVGARAPVDPRWRGVGVRIEDDVLVTADGFENLTDAVPKDPDELERLLSER